MATLSFQGQGKIIVGTVNINPASIASGAVGETAVTITGAATGDAVILNPPVGGMATGLVLSDARVSAANTVRVRLYNYTGGAVDAASGNWFYTLIRD